MNVRATALTAVVILALSGCSQRAASTLPAMPSGAHAAAPAGTRAELTRSRQLVFPSPGDLDAGFEPSISMSSPSRFVEEHTSAGKLYYRFGNWVNDSAEWGQIRPSGIDGTEPSIATSGNAIVEVHYTLGSGMEFHTGVVSGDTIDWGKSVKYDDGVGPHVAFIGPDRLVEVHSGGNGALWYHVGRYIRTRRLVDFGDSIPLDNGYLPSVAANGNGTAIELHSGHSQLWYHVGHYNATTGKIDWGESKALPNSLPSSSAVTWSPQGYIVFTYFCNALSPFNTFNDYICTQQGTLNSDNKTIDWTAKSRSALTYKDVETFSTAMSGDNAILMTGSKNPDLKMQYATTFLNDRANWEGDRLETTLKGKTLRQIVFPGSHDSGMYRDDSGGFGAIALAQDQSFYEQLEGGVRYFDLRPDANLRWYHGTVDGPTVQEGLNDIASFMKQGHKEVVILKFSHFSFGDNFDEKLYYKLLDMVKNTLGPWFYVNTTNKRLADIPINDLLSGGKGIVLPLVDQTISPGSKYAGIYTYRDYDVPQSPQNGQFNAFDQWTDTRSYSEMKGDQLQKFANFDGTMLYNSKIPCDFFLLSWTLTPTSLVFKIAPEADGNLGPVMGTVRRDSHGFIPNILYVDFEEWADPTDVAVGMNARL